ncbi:hypothetical protein K3495_g15870, partial [Podosphaera aphanis]
MSPLDLEGSSKEELNVTKSPGSNPSVTSDSNQIHKDGATGPEETKTTEYIKQHYDGYIQYNFTGEQLWEAFVDDFADFSDPEDWLRGDKLITRAFRDMLRSRGVYVVKEIGANTISKRLAELVTSTSFPEWDKNDREYARVKHLLQEPPLLNLQQLQQLKITENDAQYLEPPNPQLSERARGKTPMKQESSCSQFQSSIVNERGQPPLRGNNRNWGRNKSGNYIDVEDRTPEEQNYQSYLPSKYQKLRNPSPCFPQVSPYEICPFTKEIAMLERGYPDKLKYRGDGDTFDYKLQIFLSRCKQAAIPFDATSYAFSVMLAEMPLNFFY